MTNETENLYRIFIEKENDIYFKADLNGIIADISPAIEKYTGFNNKELIGHSIMDFYCNNDEWDKLYSWVLSEEDVNNFETCLKTCYNGQWFVSSNIHVIKDEFNNPVGIEGSIRDITSRKEDEEARTRLLEELEVSSQLIEEEAGKMVALNAQLEESEEKLREINTAKDKLFSIIGHDLKNPFQAIMNLTQILKDEFPELEDEEKLQFIDMIDSASKDAFKLLENLLTWSRSQTGRIEYNPEQLQLKQMIMNVLRLLLAQATNKNISLAADISPVIIVSADKNMLDTILRNLTSNAIKFTNAGGIVHICAEETEGFIKISVSDNGIGLSPSDIDKLFKIGVKNIEIGRSTEKGTGLGLILCKEFVEKHGGQIWVDSQQDKGSTFHFTMPKA
jgi:PAS domain S-box-containing protein